MVMRILMNGLALFLASLLFLFLVSVANEITASKEESTYEDQRVAAVELAQK